MMTIMRSSMRKFAPASIGMQTRLCGLTGVSRDFIPGLRAFSYRDRCIDLPVDNSTMAVLRILHGRQDITSKDFPESEI